MDRMYQIQELYEELPEAIKHAEELQTKEKNFIQLIKDVNKYDEYEFMLKNMEEEIVHLDKQIDVMTIRYKLLKELIEDYNKKDKKSKIIAETVSKVLEAIGCTDDASIDESAD